MFATGVGFNVSQSKALLHYTIAALGDNTWAQMALGYRYWSGISLANSCEKALEYYRKVATKVSTLKIQQNTLQLILLHLCGIWYSNLILCRWRRKLHSLVVQLCIVFGS